MRKATLGRATRETNIRVELCLEGGSAADVCTGIPMFDHLLGQFAFHGKLDLALVATSLDGIRHHLIEDTAIALGTALNDALGDRAGINRFGECTLPMDDALVRAAVDFGGRGYARTALNLRVAEIDGLETLMIAHVLNSLAASARAALHVDRIAGENPHHIAEAAFKAVGRACAQACAFDAARPGVPSTKGTLV